MTEKSKEITHFSGKSNLSFRLQRNNDVLKQIKMEVFVMKKVYVSPRIEIEEFAPNEYVAACAQDALGGTLVVCDGGHEGSTPDSSWHGFIFDGVDQSIAGLHDEDYKFNIGSCGFVDPVTGEKCKRNIAENQDLDPYGSNRIKKGTASDYVWIHIEYTGTQHDDEALFRTIGSGMGGGYQDYNAAS